MDPAWIGMKLRKLLDYPEPLGDFMAFVPGTRRQQNWPSTVAYLAQLIIHRYAMLGILDENGYPTREMGILEVAARRQAAQGDAGRAVHRMRQPHRDPQGRLRLLHRLRRGGELRLAACRRRAGHASPARHFVSLEKKYERRSRGFNQCSMLAGTLAGCSASSTLSSSTSARSSVGASCLANSGL
jgi:hypothetical protein